MRLKDHRMERLRRTARHMGRAPGKTSALLIEEALRQEEFAFIDIRNSSVGRQAYIQGSGLAVWEIIMVARAFFDPSGRRAARDRRCTSSRLHLTTRRPPCRAEKLAEQKINGHKPPALCAIFGRL
jgi:hypothetical protein